MNLQKMKKADTWPAALQGRNTRVDPLTLEGMQKKIMLERFQSEVNGRVSCLVFLWLSALAASRETCLLALSQRGVGSGPRRRGWCDGTPWLVFTPSTLCLLLDTSVRRYSARVRWWFMRRQQHESQLYCVQ